MRTLILTALAFVLLSFSPALPDVINIPADYPSIQEGIVAAVNGDTVLVTAGVYYENINFNGKNIVVKSKEGPHATIIDGTRSGCVVQFNNGEGPDAVLNGFTITNGTGYGLFYTVSGGGIYCTSSPTIKNNIIRNNEAHFLMLGEGGGIAIRDPGCPLIINNLIYENTADGYGGGIFVEAFDSIIINNTITDNFSKYGGGIAYYLGGTGNILANSIVYGNGGIVVVEIYLGFTSIAASYCNIAGGWTGPGNINTDPGFVNTTTYDYHLSYLSSCRDCGDNAAVTGLTDFEGDTRIDYGTVDMGCDEFSKHLYCSGIFTPNGVIQANFIGKPNSQPVYLCIGSGVLDPPKEVVYGYLYLMKPWVLIPLIPIPASGVLEVPANIPASIPVPLDVPVQALIGDAPSLGAGSIELTNLFVVRIR